MHEQEVLVVIRYNTQVYHELQFRSHLTLLSIAYLAWGVAVRTMRQQS